MNLAPPTNSPGAPRAVERSDFISGYSALVYRCHEPGNQEPEGLSTTEGLEALIFRFTVAALDMSTQQAAMTMKNVKLPMVSR